MTTDPGPPTPAPSTLRLVRIRFYLVPDGREIFLERRHLKTVGLSAGEMPRTEAYLNQLLEQIAVEHRDERPASDYRLELTSAETGERVMDWRYVPRGEGWQA